MALIKNKSLPAGKPPIGPSFPFLEGTKNGGSLNYDSIDISRVSDRVTITFIQGKVPIYAYTFEVSDDYSLKFTGVRGQVDIEFC